MAEGITKNSILDSYFKGRVREGVGEIFHPLGPHQVTAVARAEPG